MKAVSGSLVEVLRAGSWLAAISLAGCGDVATQDDKEASGCENGACLFAPGDENDPVVAMALTAPTSDTVTLSIANTTAYDFTTGLLSFSPTFTVATKPSAALTAFVTSTATATYGVGSRLATSLGFVMGTNAFTVPAVKKGTTATLTVTIPRGQALYYIAAVSPSVDDFAAAGPLNPSSASLSFQVKGYDPNDGSKGIIVNTNGTIGASPAGGKGTVVNNTVDCTTGAMNTASNMLTDDFSTGASDLLWPSNVGYAGDFNGEWVTDGFAARPQNPSWPTTADTAPELPVVTGFVRFFDVCPSAGANLSVAASVVTEAYTDASSDTTLVVYYFNSSNALISVDTSLPLRGGNSRITALYESTIPTGTRRIAVAPMALLGPTETQTVFYDSLQVDYAPSARTATALLTDGFNSFGASSFGTNQPTGWSDYGGDWFVHTTYKFVTLWNPAWGSGTTPPPFEGGMYKDVNLGTYAAGSVLNARAFAATTFSDPDSFVLLRVTFSNGTVVDSERLGGNAWGNLDLRRIAIPTGATSARVTLVGVLGPTETSSLYADNISVTLSN